MSFWKSQIGATEAIDFYQKIGKRFELSTYDRTHTRLRITTSAMARNKIENSSPRPEISCISVIASLTPICDTIANSSALYRKTPI